MNTKDRILIFSMFDESLSDSENLERHLGARDWLNQSGIEFVELEAHAKGQEKELMILVSESHRSTVCWLLGKNVCYIESYSDRFTEIVQESGERLGLGYLKPASEEYSKTQENWLYRPDIKQYYTIEETL